MKIFPDGAGSCPNALNATLAMVTPAIATASPESLFMISSLLPQNCMACERNFNELEFLIDPREISWAGRPYRERASLGVQVRRPVDGPLHQFGGISQLQLGLDVLPVTRNCFHAQPELLRNLARTVSLAEKLEHLQFPIAELFQRVAIGQVFPVSKRLTDDCGPHLFAEVDLAIQDLSDRRQEFGGRRAFHNVATGAGAQHALG